MRCNHCRDGVFRLAHVLLDQLEKLVSQGLGRADNRDRHNVAVVVDGDIDELAEVFGVDVFFQILLDFAVEGVILHEGGVGLQHAVCLVRGLVGKVRVDLVAGVDVIEQAAAVDVIFVHVVEDGLFHVGVDLGDLQVQGIDLAVQGVGLVFVVVEGLLVGREGVFRRGGVLSGG